MTVTSGIGCVPNVRTAFFMFVASIAKAAEPESYNERPELGQTSLLTHFEARPIAARAKAKPTLSLQRESELWAVRWNGAMVHVRDLRGMQLLAQLVARPEQELHVLQLAAGSDATVDGGDAGPALDRTAINAYRHRLLDLRTELEEAESFADVGRIERARIEIDALTAELARSVGLGGRERRVAGAAERARTTVQKRIREAIRRIEDALPDAGRHLDHAVYTGAFCGYFPSGRRR